MPNATPVPHARPGQRARARSRSAAQHAGGPSHSRYGHRQRPARLDVRCPRCAGLALASPMTDAHQDLHIASDLGPLWNQPLHLRCTACPYRASNVPYERLPPLFHQLSIGARTLWAWNDEHLDMIARALQGQDVRRHPYGFFAAYIQRGWLQWRKKFSQAISRHQRKLAS